MLWISESGNKVIQRDDELARALGLRIETDKLLPDTILVDLSPSEPLIVFVEAVATAGEITEARRTGFLELIAAAGFKASQVAFVTAFEDRNSGAFKRAISNLAWGFVRLVPERAGASDRARRGRSRRHPLARKLYRLITARSVEGSDRGDLGAAAVRFDRRLAAPGRGGAG